MYSPLRCETIECARRGEQFGIPGSRDKCIRDEKGGGKQNSQLRVLTCAQTEEKIERFCRVSEIKVVTFFFPESEIEFFGSF